MSTDALVVRHAQGAVEAALADTRVVVILGARQVGKSTLRRSQGCRDVHQRDFRGLAHLRDKLGDRFKAGALLYTGPSTVVVGDRLAAVPREGLWSP